MLQSFGASCARWAERWVPEPLVLAAALNLVVLAVAWMALGEWSAVGGLAEAWYQGLWAPRWLAFAFQMAFMLATGSVLVEAPWVAQGIRRLAGCWQSPAGAVRLTAFTAALLSWLHWGLGLMGGAFLAREIGREARRRQQALPFGLVVAAAYGGFLLWHGGLSGSAPLLVAQADHPQAELVGAIPISQTIFSWNNLGLSLALLLILPWLLGRMAHRAGPQPIPDFDQELLPAQAPSSDCKTTESEGEAAAPSTFHRWTRRAWLLWLPAVWGLVLLPAWFRGHGGVDLNAVLFLFLTMGIALHPDWNSLSRAFRRGAGQSAGILLQFPLYFAAMGVLQESGLVTDLAHAAASATEKLAGGTAWLGPVYRCGCFAVAGLVNLVVPSGGGQWALQGPVVLAGAERLGESPAAAVLATAYGDEWTNLLQPFWALPLLSVTKTRARTIFGWAIALWVLVLPLYLLALLLPPGTAA
ncbi:MAG: short-chain fatty acid transporter [Planctomycetota bacterium]|nr:MAG: short-chain fatty acid transporter [Planctomycetota bacterium]